MGHHLNRSNLHLSSSGSKVLGSNFCKYLRRANLPPSGQELATAAAGFRKDHLDRYYFYYLLMTCQTQFLVQGLQCLLMTQSAIRSLGKSLLL